MWCDNGFSEQDFILDTLSVSSWTKGKKIKLKWNPRSILDTTKYWLYRCTCIIILIKDFANSRSSFFGVKPKMCADFGVRLLAWHLHLVSCAFWNLSEKYSQFLDFHLYFIIQCSRQIVVFSDEEKKYVCKVKSILVFLVVFNFGPNWQVNITIIITF